MGEKSKLIGEYGESSVARFLKMIGWGEPSKSIEFKCTTESHEKRTHGLDFFYAYKSPLVDLVLKKIYISVKFTDKPYPNSPSAKFKEHCEDLITAIECFDFSSESKQITSAIKHYDSIERNGLLFWLSNDTETYSDLISKVSSIKTISNGNYNCLYIVDNKRIDFIYKAILYCKNIYSEQKLTFFYPDTGKNINPITRQDFGDVLPVEYINSSILPIRLEDTETDTTTLSLFTIEPFETNDLKRLINLSQRLTNSWPAKVIIAFPNYNETRHQGDVRIAKSFFDNDFTERLIITSYDNNFRKLQE